MLGPLSPLFAERLFFFVNKFGSMSYITLCSWHLAKWILGQRREWCKSGHSAIHRVAGVIRPPLRTGYSSRLRCTQTSRRRPDVQWRMLRTHGILRSFVKRYSSRIVYWESGVRCRPIALHGKRRRVWSDVIQVSASHVDATKLSVAQLYFPLNSHNENSHNEIVQSKECSIEFKK